jgi:hypothetical protein
VWKAASNTALDLRVLREVVEGLVGVERVEASDFGIGLLLGGPHFLDGDELLLGDAGHVIAVDPKHGEAGPEALIAVLGHAGSVAHSHRQTETHASLGQRLIHLGDKCRPVAQGRACDVLSTNAS